MEQEENTRKHSVPLPPELRTQLDAFRKELWRRKISEAIFAGLLGLFVSYLIVFALDRFIETPALVRTVILLAGVSLFALFAPYVLQRWVWRQRANSQLSKLIGKTFPALGDRMLGAVELSEQKGSADTMSPALRQAALENVARDVGHKDLMKALPQSKGRYLGVAVIAFFALAISVLVTAPDAGLNAFKRWILPLSDTPRYTFAQIEGVPDNLIVPYGEQFPLNVRLATRSTRAPANARVKVGSGDWVTAEKLEDDRYDFLLPGQQAVTFLTLQVGDVIKEVRVEPVLRPTLEELEAVVTLPSYLERPEQSLTIGSGYLSAVVGSEIELRGKASRSLKNVKVGPVLQRGPEGAMVLSEDNGDLEPTADSDDFQLKGIRLRSEPLELPLVWTDSYGLENKEPYRLRIEPLPDAAPAVFTKGAERQLVLLEEETIEFEIVAEDDWGLRELGVAWSGTHTSPTEEAPASGELIVQNGSSEKTRLSETFSFSPNAFDISPQRLELRAFTSDYLPERGRVYSEAITVHVLSKDQHAQLVQRRFERLLSQLDDVARQEQENLDENKRIERLDKQELQEEEVQGRLAEQEREEGQTELKLKDLSEEMEELFKDALRNGEIVQENMKQLAQTNENLRELAQEDIPEVREKLQDAQDRKNTAEKTAADVQEAVEKQEEALEKLQKTIEEANETKERLEASTFVNRLRRASEEQGAIAQNLFTLGKRTVGLETSRIDPADQRALEELTTEQRRVLIDVRWIREDLSSYYSRTQKEIHKELSDQIAESGIIRELGVLQRQIGLNLTFSSIRPARRWSDTLADWAALLEGDLNDGAGGGGGGGGGPGPDEDFEFMLRVMKMIQTEQDLRARTRSLEQLRRHRENAEAEPAPQEEPTLELSEAA